MSYRKGRRTTSGGASTAAGRTRCGRCAVSPPARTAHDRPLAHPFLALLIAAIATGLIAGASPADTVEYITTGFGETLGSIGIVIILGVMIGKLLEISGAADAIAASFLAVVGRGREDWAMAGTGALVSIPVFCDSGFVIMHPVPRSLNRATGRSFVTMSLALGVGMTLTHHLVPPTPGPLAVAGLLNVDLGRLIIFGGLMALALVPVVTLYARWIGPQLDDTVHADIREELAVGADTERGAGGATATSTATGGAPASEGGSRGATDAGDPLHLDDDTPGALRAYLPLIVPILLIVGNTVSTAIARGQPDRRMGPAEDGAPAHWAGLGAGAVFVEAMTRLAELPPRAPT